MAGIPRLKRARTRVQNNQACSRQTVSTAPLLDSVTGVSLMLCGERPAVINAFGANVIGCPVNELPTRVYLQKLHQLEPVKNRDGWLFHMSDEAAFEYVIMAIIVR
jgi:hypothetical protein